MFMAIQDRKDRERDEVRRKILDAAHKLFESLGYEAVTMRAVAEAIEYSPGTIYLHFSSKDALVDALCQEDFATLLEEMTKSPLPEDPVARLRALGRAYADFALNNPNHYRFMFMTQARFATHPDREDPGQQSFAVLRDCVVRLMNAGVIPPGDADRIGHVMWAAVHGAVALLLTYAPEQFPYAPPDPKFVETVMDVTLAGLRAGSPSQS